MAKTISQKDYYTLVGLLEVAKRQNATLREIERTIAQILGEPGDGSGYFGHISDEIFSVDPDVNHLVQAYELAIEQGDSSND